MRRYSKEEKDAKFLSNKRKCSDSDDDSKSSPKSSVNTIYNHTRALKAKKTQRWKTKKNCSSVIFHTRPRKTNLKSTFRNSERSRV